jgi:hypothetical protein
VGKVEAKLGDFLKIKQFTVRIEKDLTAQKWIIIIIGLLGQ